MSAGVRTAPTVNGTPVSKLISYSVIDAVGDIRTESVVFNGSATNVQIEALLAAIAGGTTASMFEIKVTDLYSGARNKSNASGVGRTSADDKMYFTLREPALRVTKRIYVLAPAEELFLTDTEVIDTTDTLFIAMTDAITPLLGSYTFSTVAFVEHQESNTPQTL